ncbi:MAG: transposase [Candidatus Aenigmarchaeota archaeon]|nr:transposase [Candidatus Aenigmarchaeota archaeon]
MTKLRSIKDIELEIIQKNIDWEILANIIPKKRSKVGRKSDYSDGQMLRVMMLQDIESIEYDTDMARKLKSNPSYKEFCGFIDKTPAHDKISRFKRTLKPKTLKKIHEKMDQILEKSRVFDNDELCGDGTKIPLPIHANIGSWGATSGNDKFFGLWLMTMNSTNTELVRDFNIGTAKIGQVVLMKGLIHNTSITEMERLGNNVYLDGIFDDHETRQHIFRDWNKIPKIPYNPRNSKIKKAKDLPDDNWRLVFTPGIRNEEKFKKDCRPRTGVERENSRLKQWTLIGRIHEKAIRAFRTTGRYIVNQMIISMISTQVRALAHRIQELMQPVAIQYTLKNF